MGEDYRDEAKESKKNILLIEKNLESFKIKPYVAFIDSLSNKERGMRNAKRAMSWLQGKPCFDDIVKKIAEVESHIAQCGESHPLHSDFTNALFLLKEAERRHKKTGNHHQRTMDFSDDDSEPVKKRASKKHVQLHTVITPTSTARRDKVYQSLRRELESLS